MIAGPGDETAAAASQGHGGFRASHADREQVIGTLKTAFMQGRLTEEELGERADQVYGSRTYAELAGVTPVPPTSPSNSPEPVPGDRATRGGRRR